MSDTPTPAPQQPTFTAGNWHVRPALRPDPLYVRGGSPRMDEGGPNICHVFSGTVGDEQANSNALLIAAAPELFAVVRDFKIYTDGLSAGQPQHGALLFELYHRMGAALAKATGLPADQIGPATISSQER